MCSNHAACDRKDTDTLFFIIFIYFLIIINGSYYTYA